MCFCLAPVYCVSKAEVKQALLAALASRGQQLLQNKLTIFKFIVQFNYRKNETNNNSYSKEEILLKKSKVYKYIKIKLKVHKQIAYTVSV